METKPEVGTPSGLKRLVGKAAALGVLAGAITLWLYDGPAAVGVLVGSLVASVYGWGYLRNHLARMEARTADSMFDKALFARAMGRLGSLAVFSTAIYVFWPPGFVGYLIGFGVAFAILVASEVPRLTRELRARGVIG